MNILFFYQYFGTPAGSWSTRVYELTRRWVAAGHKVTVVTSPYEKSDIRGKGFISHQNIEGIHLVVINSADSNRNGLLKRAWHALLFSLVAIKYALTLSCNVVVASSGPITIGLPALAAKWLRGKKMVFEVRDLWPAGGIELGKIKNPLLIWLGKEFEKILYKNATLIVTSSKGQADYVSKINSVKKIITIPNAADLEMYQTIIPDKDYLSGLDNKSIFLHIGSLGYIHNCKFILQAAIILKRTYSNHNIAIIMIGDGAERELLEKIKNDNALNFVYFTGLKPKALIPFWLKKAVATLFTTLNFPVQDTCSPNKLFDSFAAGAPVIQTTNGWINELIEDYKCGINVHTPDEMANAMMQLSTQNDYRNHMSKNAFSLAKNKFNIEILAKEYLEELKEICKS